MAQLGVHARAAVRQLHRRRGAPPRPRRGAVVAPFRALTPGSGGGERRARECGKKGDKWMPPVPIGLFRGRQERLTVRTERSSRFQPERSASANHVVLRQDGSDAGAEPAQQQGEQLPPHRRAPGQARCRVRKQPLARPQHVEGFATLSFAWLLFVSRSQHARRVDLPAPRSGAPHRPSPVQRGAAAAEAHGGRLHHAGCAAL